MTYTIGELFAGYGGLGQGVELALGPARTAWVSDVDPGANKILAHRYPDAPNIGDITTVDWTQVEPVDVITGGSPCQDLSHAGKRLGMKAGTRSGLWASMCDAIDIIRPGLVVWENVRGALSAEADSALEPCPGCVGDGDDGPVLRALGRVLGDLAELGYVGGWVGLRAADVGAPHGRFRVFVVARPGTTGHTDRTPGQGEVSVVRRGQVPNPVGGVRPAHLTLLPTPAVNDMGAGKTVEHWDAWTARMQAKHGNGNGHGPSLSIEALRLLPTPTSTDHKASGASAYEASDTHHTGTTLTDATVRQSDTWGQYAAAIQRWEALTRTAPAPTTPDGREGAHRLSPAFVEWMMGLPSGWVTDTPGVTRNEALKALGNGVVPQQAGEAVSWLLAQLESRNAA